MADAKPRLGGDPREWRELTERGRQKRRLAPRAMPIKGLAGMAEGGTVENLRGLHPHCNFADLTASARGLVRLSLRRTGDLPSRPTQNCSS